MSYYQERELQDEHNFLQGDPVRCHIHGEVIRSADGLYDGVCGGCEYKMDRAYEEQEEQDTEEALWELTKFLDSQPHYDMVSA
jgi:hypothetical protein